MKDKISPPNLPRARDQFDPIMFDDYTRRLILFLQELLSTGHCDIHTLKLTGLPTSEANQFDDTVYVDDGYLHLVGQSQANHHKAGNATILTGNTSQAVTFNTAFSDNNYAVTLGDDDNQFVWITSKSASGFTLNRVGSANDEEVWWIAFPFSDL